MAARHVAFSLAVRERDTLAAARAASRLRVAGALVTPREFTAGRRARAAVGLALVRARLPKPERAEPTAAAAAPRTLRRPRPPIWRALAVAGAAGLVFLLLLNPGGGFFGGGSTEPSKPAGVDVPAAATLRGRTVAQASAVVVTSPRPTATPPVVVPGRSASPVPIGGVGGGSPVPGGGGGIGPTPAPGGTPAVPPLGFGRLTVIVVDSQTQQPVPDVCVVIGSGCDPSRPHTNAQGKWSGDIQLPAKKTLWDMYLTKSGYATQYKQTELIQGEEVIVRISLVRG